MRIVSHEWRTNYKTFAIWFLAVAIFCGGCMCLFPMMDESMEGMEEAFASMGAFTQAFGLDRLSIATIEGFFAAEVGTIYALGGGIFAALMGIGLLSKEEGGHTADFLYTLPLSRTSIFLQKYLTLVTMLLFFGLLNFSVFLLCFSIIGETVSLKIIAVYMILQYLLQLEIGTFCYLISALTKRVQMGIGLGLALVFYMLDIVSRITDEMEVLKYFTPFYYANASDIVSNKGNVEMPLVVISLVVTVACLAGGLVIFRRRDLAS